MSMFLLGNVCWGADDPDQSIKIFTWQGPGSGWSSDVNQSKLMTNGNDRSDVDWYPTYGSIDKMKNSDVVYVENHGGKVTTHAIPFLITVGYEYAITNLMFPKEEDKGPSLILNWGCQNGNDHYVKTNGTVVNLLEAYATGFGIDCNSKTKVYIAPKIDVGSYAETAFQSKFYEEFGKGHVTVEQAVKLGYEAWKKNFANPAIVDPLDKMIGICGNSQLTLNQLRANLAQRKVKPDQSIVVLIDGSGSMKGEKIAIFKKVAVHQIEALKENVEVALVLFNGCGSIHVLSDFLMMTPANKKTLQDKINGIEPNGDTNLAEATDFAWKYLDEHARSVNQGVIELTDGMETCNGDPVKAAGNINN
ncbi:MAG: hypothetical protein A2X46_11190 [Lentisphaerae bacterium GWF2_57_35]|nr:MAG: hypothetical protein A2X46_11190 [Lentisphaerae bacterium GWF2_57_35]